MKRNLWNILTVVLFAAVLLAMPVAFLLLPRRTFSEAERRYLAEPPKLSEEKLSDWSFDDKTETYLADHMPLRNALVSIEAYTALYTGRQVSEEIYCDAEGYLVEAPVREAPEEIEKRVRRIAALGRNTGLTPYLLVIPSTGYVRNDMLPKPLAALYRDDAILTKLSERDGVRLVPILNRFEAEGQRWFYRTDHHWNADGAFAAYEAYMRAAGHEPLSREAFTRREIEGYSGSTQSRSALWLHRKDVLTLDEPIGVDVSVTFSDREGTFTGLFFEEHLKEYDWYPIFLDGNHPVTVIENRNAPADAPNLLLVKDSFGNSLAPYFVPSYRTIVMVDPRYHKQSVVPLVEQYAIDELLFCYSLDRITNDESLKLLK